MTIVLLINCVWMELTLLYREFGRLVQNHRRRVGLTQSQLGQRVGLARTSITNIEHGRQKVLLHQMFALAESLEILPETLLPAIVPSAIPSRIEEKLGKQLKGAEKEWVRRIIASGSKGGTLRAPSKR